MQLSCLQASEQPVHSSFSVRLSGWLHCHVLQVHSLACWLACWLVRSWSHMANSMSKRVGGHASCGQGMIEKAGGSYAMPGFCCLNSLDGKFFFSESLVPCSRLPSLVCTRISRTCKHAITYQMINVVYVRVYMFVYIVTTTVARPGEKLATCTYRAGPA